MKLVCFTSFILLIAALSCKKSTTTLPISGVWVESLLRLDTLDFQNMAGLPEPALQLLSKPYSDPVLNPNYPVSHANIYHFKLNSNKDSIFLRSYLSSSLSYNTYQISFSGNGKILSIDKFYNRRALPAVIEFERIK